MATLLNIRLPQGIRAFRGLSQTSGFDAVRHALTTSNFPESSWFSKGHRWLVTRRMSENNDSALSSMVPRRIKALDQDVVNKIAAGEIIVAPVHALKELTENAVDAGSTAIEILVKDGGLKLLQITDNGHGINRDDLPILCERFTTSKLKAFEDLTAIGTYGFRGEALASISHIAHLRVTTRTSESSCAWQAHYASGKLTPAKPGQSAEPKACAGRQGTQITVEDLFYNVPTRRRAFRSASEEYAKILDVLGRYAVHCSGVAFTCKKHGDATVGIAVQANASTVDRIRGIHGSAVANELIPFEAESERWGFKAEGYISNANYHVKKMVLLLFINHRAVESSTIKKAIEQTYSTFLPKGGHAFVYLSLNIDPQRVDVNVHPTKREVNFLNEDEIVETISDEIRARLGKVDTSRTFMTQSLLPGVRIPTISADMINTPSRSNGSRQELDEAVERPSNKRTSASRPHENNLVRTDSKVRKITSMLQPDQRDSSTSSNVADSDQIDRGGLPVARQDSGTNTVQSIAYTYVDCQPTVCRLSTVKSLRAAVRDEVHNGLTDIISSHTMVGIVDERRRITAIQSGVKLFLVDYGMFSNEYFYQVGLRDFGNFGSIRLDPPLSLRETLQVAAARERNIAEASRDPEELDWDEVVTAVEAQLVSRRDMLLEYFSLEISDDGQLLGLPLLMKGYMPSMAKLPRFLLRLGPHVDWTDEEGCFKSFLRELAGWYVPEPLPPPPSTAQRTVQQENEGDVQMEDAPEEDINDHAMGQQTSEDPSITERRREVNRAVEDVLFPAFKAKLIATKGMLKGVVEIANLKGLYRVFERC